MQTPFGKGTVRHVRNHGRLLVEVNGRTFLMEASTIGPLDATGRLKLQREKRTAGETPQRQPHRGALDLSPSELDLHDLAVHEALAAVEEAVNRALLADVLQLRLIHGRSGGRLRVALHRWLRGTPSVRSFALDPRNPGVTIVRF